jgi:hypothetical protein
VLGSDLKVRAKLQHLGVLLPISLASLVSSSCFTVELFPEKRPIGNGFDFLKVAQ